MSATPELPEIKESKTILDAFFMVRCDSLFFPRNHHAVDYYSIETRTDAVSILAKTKEGLFVVNEEYRYPVRRYLLSLPGGYMDDNESPEQSAERELLEETGYKAERFVLMGSSYPYAGVSNQQLFYVVALGAEKVAEPKLEPAEILRTSVLNIEEINRRIAQGAPTDGILCTALYYWANQ